MAAASPEAKRLLNQLQSEINRVLEQTGRLFAAARTSGSVPPAAQASRLKQALPDCIDKFHSALDELEDELQTAKIVLRRDLALLRAKDGSIQPSGNADGTESRQEVRPHMATSDDSKPAGTIVHDIDMTDDPPDEAQLEQTRGPSPKPEQGATATLTGDKLSEKPAESSTDLPAEAQPAGLDTSVQPNKSAEDGQADPGTASNHADLDSLFGGSADASNEAGNDTFDMDATNDNDAGDFDFGAFTNELDSGAQGGVTDDENIAALLPGLQDYANTGTAHGAGGSGDAEFDAIFGDNSNDPQDTSGGQADDIFGDLLADFPSGGYNNATQDHDFDFGFS